ncbi:hypothetical protein BJF78_28875 [Pseudonocardia sp. CNS-139]|nr:hypothetical protein BJF78_28875 [Pseudonocardia sp. CNS-139]
MPRREQLVEEQLVQAYATSRNAVREAMSLLADEGLVTRSPRHGTVVVGGIAEMALDDISPQRGSLPEPESGFRNPGDYQNTMLECARIPVTPLLQLRLRTAQQAVWMAEWMTLRAGEPVAIFTNYWLEGERRELGTESSSPGLEASFLRSYGRPLGRIDTSVESVMCDERTGRILGVDPGAPLLFRERLLSDATARRASATTRSSWAARSRCAARWCPRRPPDRRVRPDHAPDVRVRPADRQRNGHVTAAALTGNTAR